METKDIGNAHVPAKMWEFFSILLGRNGGDFEEERKRSVLAFFLIIGIAILFPFAIYHFILGNVIRAILLLFVGSIQLASLTALRYLKQASIIFRLNVILLGAYFAFLIIVGGTQGSRILWVFIFPLFAFFLLGKKEGLFWSALQCLFSAIIIIDPGTIFETFPYETAIAVRFFIVYGIIVLMSYFVEAARHRIQEAMDRDQLKLETEVEERRRAEELWRQESSFGTAVIERAAEGLCVCHEVDSHPNVVFTDWNDRMTEITGYTMEEINRLGWYQTLYPDTKLQRQARDKMARMRTGEDIRDEEWVITRADGEKAVVSISTSVLDTGGGITHVLALVHDITLRKRAEESLRDLTAFFSVLATIRGVGQEQSEDELWQVFLNSITAEYGFLMAWYGNYADDRVAPKHSAGRVDRYLEDLVLEIREPTSPDAHCAMSRAILGCRSFGYADLAHDVGFRRWRSYALELGYRSNLALPLELDSRIEGGVMVYADTVAAFPEERVERLNLLMSEMGNAIKERRQAKKTREALREAYDSLEKQVEDRTADLRQANRALEEENVERKRTEEALKDAYDIISKSPAVAFLWKNAETWPVEFVSVNVKMLFGYSAEDFTSGRISYLDVIHPEDLQRVAEEVSGFSNEEGRERFNHEPYRIITKEGRVKWVRDSTFIRRGLNGQITHYQGIVEDITGRRHTEAVLRQSEVRFRTLVENSPAGIFLIDGNYRFVYANEELSNILGFSQEKIMGLDFRDVLDDESREFVADRYVLRQQGEDVPPRYEIGIVRKDGQKRRLEMVATAITGPDGSVQTMGQSLDITERKQIEDALRSSEKFLQDVFDGIQDGISVLDTDLNIVRVNHRMEEMYRSKSPLVGKKCHEVYQERDDICPWCPSIHTLKTGEMHTEVVPIPSAVNPEGWLELSSFPLKDTTGDVKGVIEHVKDITDRKKTEEDLARHRNHLEELVEARTKELETAQEELLKKERLSVLGQLTATVSHELRNPLSVIRSSAFYLQGKVWAPDNKVQKHLWRIEEQIELCDSIVDDLLEYTRGRHSKTAEGEINPWLEQVLEEIPEIGEVKLDKFFDENLPKLLFDPEKMRRVVVNLVNNALQAVDERKQKDTDKDYQPIVKVSSKRTDGGVLIIVADNGIGMDEKTAKRAFEPLFTTKARGTGLGLANVRKIIDEHDGRMSIASEPYKETRVTVKIPAVNED